MFKRIAFVSAFVLALALTASAWASQNNLWSPTTGTVNGLGLTNNYNSAIDSVNTCNSGASAPTNQLSGVPSLGNCWIDTATTPNTLYYYDGANWLPEAYLDTVNHIWIPVLGGGNGTPTIASATTTNLCPSSVGATVAPAVEVTGTTTITGFGTNCGNGAIKIVEFGGALTLTNSSSLVLLTGANITTAAGDWAIFIYISGTGWTNVAYQKANGSALSSVGLNIGAAALANSSLAPLSPPTNLQLNAAVASNELTVSVCTINSGSNTCNNASSSNPILFAFRDPTAANGDPVIVSQQASLSFTTGATSDSFGCATGVLCRLWVWAINNGGTIDLCVYNAENGTNISDLNEGVVQTSASGTGGGTSAQTLYCSASSVSSKAVKRLGYVDATWTSGTGWSGPTFVQLFGPGIRKPGDLIQSVYNSTASPGSSSTNNYSPSSTPPTASNTNSIITQAIVPTSAVNILHATAGGVFGGNGTGGSTTALIWNGSAAVAVSSGPDDGCAGGASDVFAPTMNAYNVAGGTSSITYGVYAAASGSGTVYWLECNASIFGGTSVYLRVDEIMGKLEDEPVNDNADPGMFAMTG